MSANQSETGKLLEHEYDGIREYDNPMPGWWKTIFWLSFFYAIGYFFHYHVSKNGDSVEQSYVKDVSAAREREAQAMMGNEVTKESLQEFMDNKSLMLDAKNLFKVKCEQCHGANAEGKIGPNLTDTYWLHGDGSLMSLYTVIQTGVPDKGMPPWGRQLRPVELRKIVAYVGTLRNTNVAGPKGPEGSNIEPSP